MTWPGASPRPSRPSCATASRTCKRHRHARGRPQGSGRRAETVRIFHFPHQSAAARAGRGQSPGPGRPGQPGKQIGAQQATLAKRRVELADQLRTVHQRSVALDGAAVRRRSAIAGPQSGLPGLRVPGPRPGGAGAARRHRPAGRVAGQGRRPSRRDRKSGGRDHRAEDRPGRPAERALHAAGPVGRADRRPARRGQQAGPGRPAPVAPDHRPGRGHRQAGRGSPSRGRGAQEAEEARRAEERAGPRKRAEGRGRASRRGSPQESRRSAPRRGRASRCRRRAPQPRCAGCAGRGPGARAGRGRRPPAARTGRRGRPGRRRPASGRSPVAYPPDRSGRHAVGQADGTGEKPESSRNPSKPTALQPGPHPCRSRRRAPWSAAATA